jgi:hypothetical protein
MGPYGQQRWGSPSPSRYVQILKIINDFENHFQGFFLPKILLDPKRVLG